MLTLRYYADDPFRSAIGERKLAGSSDHLSIAQARGTRLNTTWLPQRGKRSAALSIQAFEEVFDARDTEAFERTHRFRVFEGN